MLTIFAFQIQQQKQFYDSAVVVSIVILSILVVVKPYLAGYVSRVSVIFDMSPTHGRLPIVNQIDILKGIGSKMSLEVA